MNRPDTEYLVLHDYFSGIGGFHLGLSNAGFKFSETYYSEIDKHAIANYKYNFKDAKYLGSITDILQSGARRPNIITFGSPCQDFSLAGNRKGLAGDYAHSSTTGFEAISSSLGIKSKAMAVNGWVIIVDWRYSDNWYIHEIYHAKVGQKILDIKILPNVWYWFDNGVLNSEENN